MHYNFPFTLLHFHYIMDMRQKTAALFTDFSTATATAFYLLLLL